MLSIWCDEATWNIQKANCNNSGGGEKGGSKTPQKRPVLPRLVILIMLYTQVQLQSYSSKVLLGKCQRSWNISFSLIIQDDQSIYWVEKTSLFLQFQIHLVCLRLYMYLLKQLLMLEKSFISNFDISFIYTEPFVQKILLSVHLFQIDSKRQIDSKKAE